MENLGQLKNKRTVLKANLSKFKTSFEEIRQRDSIDIKTINIFETKCKRVMGYLDQFFDIQIKIEEGQVEEGEEFCVDELEREWFESTYDNNIPEACSFVEQYKRVNNPIPNPSTNLNLAHANEHREIAVKLPAMNLPRFDGSYEHWMAFNDRFAALIDNNPSITAVQKLDYLKSCLSGAAERLIEPLNSTAANYEVAKSILSERFYNKRIIIYKHVEAIYSIESFNKESAVAIRNMLDTVGHHIKCLGAFEQPTESWDTLLICALRSKVDNTTRREWENMCTSELPSLENFLAFLRKKCETLENTSKQLHFSIAEAVPKRSYHAIQHIKNDNNQAHKRKCVICSGLHQIYVCEQFLKLSAEERHRRVSDLKLCYKCLRENHTVAKCRLNNCRLCNRGHNILLHRNRNTSDSQVTNNQSDTAHQEVTNLPGPSSQYTGVVKHNKEVLLSTAVVLVENNYGKQVSCRVLLDSGSQSHFISGNLCQKLGLKRDHHNMQICGINGALSSISESTVVTINSIRNNYRTTINCFVIPSITGHLPPVSFPIDQLKIPKNMKLADPGFNVSTEVDMLIGADVFYRIISNGKHDLGANLPVLQNTYFGWILGGNLDILKRGERYNYHCTVHIGKHQDIDCMISKLWEDETTLEKRVYTQEEKYCETHFVETCKRDDSGRFIVKIPLKDNSKALGESRHLALKRFYALERKLDKNEELKKNYTKFMREYEQLGHMQKVTKELGQHLSYYIPHHPVINNNSSTTKLRVVFDASMQTDSGISLNEIQMVGPTIQADIFQLLNQFRHHRIVLTADIEKMYRQVKLDERQRTLQRIFWRENNQKPVEVFELSTVTYGLASAPFLAIRSLYQLGINCMAHQPEIAEIIKNNFYVDDLITGAESIVEAKQIREELSSILSSAGFQLRKWCSNEKTLRNSPENEGVKILFDKDTIKTLGIWWNPREDVLQYTCNIGASQGITKRSIVSMTGKLFDPLGLVCPVIIQAKFIIQEAWKLMKSWDDELPYSLANRWTNFIKELPEMEELKLPRRSICSDATVIEIHGFSDASEQGFRGCVYIRSRNNHKWLSILLCAKAKVAPLKTITLARLELNAALLVSRLMKKVRESLTKTLIIHSEHVWCDSTIVLAWINSAPNKWKIYVAHRVAEIQENTQVANWRHVKSIENPADLITRGASISKIKDNKLWWSGPSWLEDDNNFGRENNSIINEYAEEREEYRCEQRAIANIVSVTQVECSIINKFSTYGKLVRITAWCFRFYYNCHTKQRTTGSLKRIEFDRARIKLIKIVQIKEFSQEISELIKHGKISQSSKLRALAPILDKDGILRVGGRLQNSQLKYEQKHPILLPKSNNLTELIAREMHIKNLHCGQQALLASLRQIYWPIGGRWVVKRVIHNCVVCFKCNPVAQATETGQLPESRTAQTPPFYNTGLDFAGPFMIRDKRSRGSKLIKAYICLFVCFAIKAVHLELVSDLSTEAFLAALRRFIARRGKPITIHSDNATNFRGAYNELKRIVENQAKIIANLLIEDGIEWRFIPPNSPHFGGIWEAGVKSVKTHLMRVIGNANLVFEEFCTVLAQIEAILNSRPLCPLSNDPNDLCALTPAHFLIGRTLTGAPDVDLQDVQSNRLSRFQRTQQLQQHFWARWGREYVSQLQQRPKNKTSSTARTLKVGVLVLVREDKTPPLMWQLGRITDMHPGADGITRVVTVRTQKGILKREVRKICVLPIEQE